MSGKKQITTDELMDIALSVTEEVDNTDYNEYKNDILAFVHKLNIEPGDNKVNRNTLYLIYKAWSDSPLTRKEFSTEVGKLFPCSDNRTVLINKNSIKLTHEAYTKFKKSSYVLKSAKTAERFNDFLKYFSIQPGDYYIELDFLYLIYTRYAEQKGIISLFSRLTFEKFCRLNFLSKQLATGPAFAVKPNVENFFEKGELKKLRRNHGKKKKTNKKK